MQKIAPQNSANLVALLLLLAPISISGCSQSNFAASSTKKPTVTTGTKNDSQTTETPTIIVPENPGDQTVVIDGEGFAVAANCLKADFQSKIYLICKGPKSKIDATSDCTAKKMNLAQIDSEEENKWVVDTALKTHGCLSYEQTSYWISNMSLGTSATWPAGGPRWAPKEPLGDGNDINILRYCNSPYGWNDLNSSLYKLGWICKSK